jgi:hypothetical protein
VIEAGELRPLGVGETLDSAVKLYRDHFLDLLKAAAIVLVPVTVLNFLVLLSVPPADGTNPSFTPTGPLDLVGGSAAAGGAAFVIFVIALVAGALAQAACLRIVIDAYLGRTSGWRESLGVAFRRGHSVVWVTVLFTAGTLGGYLFCVVPGIWLYGAWAVAIPALLVEGERGTKALTRSFRLVRRRWWPTAGVLVVAYLLTAVVTSMFALVLVPLVLSDASDTATQAANAVASGVATLLTTPFSAAVAAAVYFDLRIRKEGFDIALLAQGRALAARAASPASPVAPTPAPHATPRPGASPPAGPGAPPWATPPSEPPDA